MQKTFLGLNIVRTSHISVAHITPKVLKKSCQQGHKSCLVVTESLATVLPLLFQSKDNLETTIEVHLTNL